YQPPAGTQTDAHTHSGPSTTVHSGPVAVLLSAHRPDVLRESATRWVEVLRRGDYRDADLPALSYTSQTGRTAMAERLAVVAGTLEELRAGLESWLRGEPNPAVFTGRAPRDGDAPAAPAALTDGFASGGRTEARHWAPVLQAWTTGAECDWRTLWGERHPQRISMPTYPFQLRRYWLDMTTPAHGPHVSRGLHPLVHRNTSDLSEQRYTSHFTGREFYIADHRVQGEQVVPGAALLEMARAAAVLAAGGAETDWALRQVVWSRPLTAGRSVDVHTAVSVRADGEPAFEIYTEGPGGERVVHSTGRLHRRTAGNAAELPGGAGHLDVAALRAQCDGTVLDAEECYARFSGAGLEYGPTLRAVETLSGGTRQGVARLRLSAAASARTGFTLHPSLLDAALQSTAGLFTGSGTSSAALPFALDRLEVLRATPSSGWAVARFAADDRPGGVRRLDIDVCDDDGHVCVRIRGFQVRTYGGDTAPSASGAAADSTSRATEPGAPGTGNGTRAVTANGTGHGTGNGTDTGTGSEADADARLLHLIHAIGEGALSADEFQRSLI
ncbi:polyketide synthase PksN, partial [Streptomyces sp. Amel2xB2]|uniref:polyketide synthase dehydratase domain-containing protein n=1 Tax=Streptomyces sp. Amel2xB2 TaxID=1305829 RepID=UPI000DC008FA